MILNHTNLLNFASPCLFSPLAAMPCGALHLLVSPRGKRNPVEKSRSFPFLRMRKARGPFTGIPAALPVAFSCKH